MSLCGIFAGCVKVLEVSIEPFGRYHTLSAACQDTRVLGLLENTRSSSSSSVYVVRQI
jgi:hypothetical protein